MSTHIESQGGRERFQIIRIREIGQQLGWVALYLHLSLSRSQIEIETTLEALRDKFVVLRNLNF